jgi:hypothetical protein
MIKALSLLYPRRHLFVLSHMRSYSSLLCHILGSHPDIDGYCETHVKYRRSVDLIRLRHRVTRFTGAPLRGRYVLDKVLHDYPMAPSILQSRNTRAIILLRNPFDSVQSILNMGERYIDVGWYRDPERASRYYATRIAQLIGMAESMPGRVAFLESEALLTETDAVLKRLSEFLELKAPLSRHYNVFAHTGQPGYGDPSESILRGEVRPTPETRSGFRIPQRAAAHLDQAYRDCMNALRSRCQAVAL